MALIYLAGMLSGALLVIIALYGWIQSASREIQGKHGTPTRQKAPTHSSATPVARHAAHGRHGRDSPYPAAA